MINLKRTLIKFSIETIWPPVRMKQIFSTMMLIKVRKTLKRDQPQTSHRSQI